MHEPFRELVENQFIPTIAIKQRPDNGHYEASAMGLKVTHHDQAQAVSALSMKIQEGILSGELDPMAPQPL